MEVKQQENGPHFFNISLKLILQNEKGEILGLKCPNEGTLSGFYDLPGGRINSDELQIPLERVIARETKEEVGENVKYKVDLRPVSVGKHFYFSRKLDRENCIFMIFFKAKYLGGEISVSNEHIGYKWLDLKSKPASGYFISGFLEGVEAYLKEK